MNKYIIIGGGPSGLCLAYFLTIHNVNVELFEKEKKGFCRKYCKVW